VLVATTYDRRFLEILFGRPRLRVVYGQNGGIITLTWRCSCIARGATDADTFVLDACPRHAATIHLAGNSLTLPRRTRTVREHRAA
jgi:hypothetical protein